MRYAHIISKLCSEPWAISEAGMATIIALLNSKLAQTAEHTADIQTVDGGRGVDLFTRQPLPGMSVAGGIATIPVYGVLARGIGAIEKSCGATDYLDLGRELREAAERKDVRAVKLEFDSPGGSTTGVAPLAHAIAAFRKASGKNIYAHVVGTCASAALWLASSAQEIFAEPGTMIGSVGTVLAFIDRSKEFEARGLRAEVITSSHLKVAGYPGTALSDEQRAYLQGLVNSIDGQFKEHLRATRPQMNATAMDGRIFPAHDALALRVIDRIVNSEADALARLN